MNPVRKGGEVVQLPVTTSDKCAGALIVRGQREAIEKFFERAPTHGLRVVFQKVASDPDQFFFVRELRRKWRDEPKVG
jgi:hypothetical protein